MTVEIKTLGTRELADALNRANPYEVYKDVAIRMKDAGFTEKPTLTRALEMLSPTEPGLATAGGNGREAGPGVTT